MAVPVEDDPPPEVSGERRVLTLLFADLSGYTAFCHERDPEVVHLLVRPLIASLRRVCESLGALVPGVEGDGFMAVFGARLAAEDDPGRAVDAAAQLQRLVVERQEVLPDFPNLHVGVHVGEVVVTWPGGGELEVSGDPVNVASGLAGQARGGQVLVSAECVALTGRTGCWGERRALELRGRPGVVAAHELDWHGAGDVASPGRWEHVAPYVPRSALERALREALTEAGALVVGAAGAGKTRLVMQAVQDSDAVWVSSTTFRHPTARDLLRLALHETGAAPAALLARLSAPAGQDEGADDSALLEAAGRFLGGRVVVLDDAERLPDEEVADLGIAMAGSGTRWVVVSRRPLPALMMPALEVGALSEDERQALVESLLPGASGEVRATLLRRAGDSPLYLEQCARLMVESGAVRREASGFRLVAPEALRAIPTSMRLFVSSRLDLLDEADRDVLSVAAVLGEDLDLDLLRHLTGGHSGDAVERLVERGHLRWLPGAPRPVLQFHHALVRDVAYETLLHGRRLALHLAAVEWYAVLPAAHVLEAQAAHLAAAVALGSPDCALRRRAVEVMVLYARSIELERTRVALEVLESAQRIVDAAPDCEIDTLSLDLSMGAVLLLADREVEAITTAKRALVVAGERRDRTAQAEAHDQLGRALVTSDATASAHHLAQAVEGYVALEDAASQARVEIFRSLHAVPTQGIKQQVVYLEQGYALALRSGDRRLQASTAQQLAMHTGFSSGRREFESWAARARDVSRQDDAGLEARLDTARAVLASFELAPRLGLGPARAAVAAGRDLGLGHVYRNAMLTLVDLHVMAGQLTQARALLTEARRLGSARLSEWNQLQLTNLQARLEQRNGDPAGAQELLRTTAAHPLSERAVMRHELAELGAWLALERGSFADAAQHARQAVHIDEELGDRAYSLRPRLVRLVATLAAGTMPPLSEIAALNAAAQETGFSTIAQVAARWLHVYELCRGWPVDDYHVTEVDTVEARALDREIEALSSGRFDGLEEAAATWAELGTTVWRARALLWHSELTGAEQPEADELLRVLESPDGLAEHFRSQVRDLRT